MKKTICCLLTIASLALHSAVAQSLWVVPPGSPTYDAKYVAGEMRYLTAPQPGVLWGVGLELQSAGVGQGNYQDRVFRTADNGQSWQEAPATTWFSSSRLAPMGIAFRDLAAIDGQTAWMLQDNVASGVQTLLHTTSGPGGFAPLAASLPVYFSTIHFFTATTGIAVGNVASGTTTWPIYRTIDSGFTWTLIPNAPLVAGHKYIGNKQSIGPNLWLNTATSSTSTSPQMLLRTTDEGLTWTSFVSRGAVTFENATHGLSYFYALTTGNRVEPKVIRTTDGGASWTDVAFTGRPGIAAMIAIAGAPGTYLSTDFTYPFANNNAIVRTAISYDRGANWQDVETNMQGGAIKLMHSASPNEIWAGIQRADMSLPNQPMIRRYTSSVLASRNPIKKASGLVAYPNPTTGMVYLEGEIAREEVVRVYDNVGRLCQQEKISNSTPTLDLSKLPAGLYHVLLTSATGRVGSLRVNKI
ncbi:T9SS type A sorting domain-containing protein [Hymenobacter sp. HD11105]